MQYLVLMLVIGCAYGSAVINTPKIVGGMIANDGQFPYHVAIKHVLTRKFLCSGSIISKQWVLTAGKCCPSTLHVSNMTIEVGSVVITTNNAFSYGVERTVIHPDYAPVWPSSLNHDIALIKVIGSIRFTDKVSPIALSSFFNLPTNLDVLFTGWGATNFSSVPQLPSYILKYKTLKTTAVAECESPLGGNSVSDVLIQCTARENGAGPCLYDEGGPLVYENEQVGIDFHGWSCQAPHGRPNMFTKIGPHRLWIEEVSGV